MIRTNTTSILRRLSTTTPHTRAFISATSRFFSATSNDKKVMYDVIPKEDFGNYEEFSVIFTNRSLNLMSDPFQRVMRDLSALLKDVYNANKVAIIPG